MESIAKTEKTDGAPTAVQSAGSTGIVCEHPDYIENYRDNEYERFTPGRGIRV